MVVCLHALVVFFTLLQALVVFHATGPGGFSYYRPSVFFTLQALVVFLSKGGGVTSC